MEVLLVRRGHPYKACGHVVDDNAHPRIGARSSLGQRPGIVCRSAESHATLTKTLTGTSVCLEQPQGRRQVSVSATQSLRGKHEPGSKRTPIPMRSWPARSLSAYFCNPYTLLTTLGIREKDPSEPQPFITMKVASGGPGMLNGAGQKQGQKSMLSALTVSDSARRRGRL